MQIAMQYWKAVSNTGHLEAHFRVAKCLEDGIGTSKEFIKARVWYGKSAAKGHYGAKWALKRLNEHTAKISGIICSNRLLTDWNCLCSKNVSDRMVSGATLSLLFARRDTADTLQGIYFCLASTNAANAEH